MFCKYTIIISSLFAPLLFSNDVYSEVYKWIDENGKVVYGDKPASNNADEIKIKNTRNPDQHDVDRYKKQQKLLDVMQEERDAKIALKREELEKQAQQEQKCAELRARLQKMKEASMLYEETDDPFNPKIISDEERKNEEKKYEEYIKGNCQ